MLQLEYINARNKSVNALRMYDDYGNLCATITGIEALHGVDNEFSTSTSPYVDGDFVNHIRTSPRTIILTYALHTPIERSLSYFNSVVKSKQKATLIETRSDGSKIQIEGVVTVPHYTRISDQASIQIQLYCSDPYWQDITTIASEISYYINMHWFPYDTEEKLLANDGGLCFPASLDESGNLVTNGIVFGTTSTEAVKSLSNEGDVPTGVVITINAIDKVTNPRVVRDNYNWIRVNVVMGAGDWIKVSTVRGNKYIKSNRSDVNLASIEYSGNDWLQIETGDNEFYATCEEGIQALRFSIEYKRKWQ